MHFDIIICGLGAMGSAAAYCLASSGLRVLGLDRFHPPHNRGSSHGRTRIIREAYFEHPAYVPLVQRAYELWNELEAKSGRKLLLPTGGLMIGPQDGVLFAGAKRSAEEHHLQHRLLSSEDLRREFPVFRVSNNEVAVWEPRAGILFPELCIQTHLELAAKAGAVLRFGGEVVSWKPEGNGVSVTTATGNYTADHLLISAGAWLNSVAPELHLPLSIERQVLFWFEPAVSSSFSSSFSSSSSSSNLFTPDRFPIFIWENEPHKFMYGFPDLGDGVKVAVHHQGEVSAPDRLNRDVSSEETDRALRLLKRHLPAAAGKLKSAAVCMYTNTPDEHFILDFHPAHRQVLIASPCSGHGFKFAAVIGEIVSDMLTGKKPGFDLSLFRIDRF